jgi:hypothetical protein
VTTTIIASTGKSFVGGEAYLGIANPKLIYVVVKDKATFEALQLPQNDFEHILIKTGDLAGIHMIFQYFPEANT